MKKGKEMQYLMRINKTEYKIKESLYEKIKDLKKKGTTEVLLNGKNYKLSEIDITIDVLDGELDFSTVNDTPKDEFIVSNASVMDQIKGDIRSMLKQMKERDADGLPKPKYHIKGFIDKPIKKKKEMHIIDYKSSKYKFRGDDLEANIQAMMYSLASKKLCPKLKPIVKFLFLRFPKQPIQELKFSDEQIKGFEHYLEHINNYIDNFDEKSANANFAADSDKNKWMCQIGGWKCPYKDEYEYYVKINKNGQIIESSLKEIEGAGEEYTVEKRMYKGCPKFHNSIPKKDEFLDK